MPLVQSSVGLGGRPWRWLEVFPSGAIQTATQISTASHDEAPIGVPFIVIESKIKSCASSSANAGTALYIAVDEDADADAYAH